MSDILSRIEDIVGKRQIPQLERSLGFGRDTIKSWGTSSPSVDKVVKVADHLGVSLDYLIRGEEQMITYSHNTVNGNNVQIGENQTVQITRSPRIDVILEIYEQLSDDDKKKLFAYAVGLENDEISDKK